MIEKVNTEHVVGLFFGDIPTVIVCVLEMTYLCFGDGAESQLGKERGDVSKSQAGCG